MLRASTSGGWHALRSAGGWRGEGRLVFRARAALRDFDDALAVLECRDHRGERSSERIDEHIAAAVAEAHLDETSGVPGTVREKEEVFVLADDDPRLAESPVPNGSVIRRIKSDHRDMDRIVSGVLQEPKQLRRQLVVDHESHATRTTE